MEVDFDKEIDALLRNAQRDAPALVGDSASTRHLDADEISAFAENAMPENSKVLYTRHLAECDRCRKILSNVLVMNSEAAPAAAASPSAITIAERAPWYKRLFLFPNLAYVMGGLVLMFAGFLGYTIIQSPAGDTFVTQISDNEPAKGGPNFQNEPAYPLAEAQNSANMAANSEANTAYPMGIAGANSNASTGAAPVMGQDAQLKGARASENSFVLDGVNTPTDMATGAKPSAPVAAAPPPPKEERERDDAKDKAESKLEPNREVSKSDLGLLKQSPGAGVQTQSGPMRNNENQYNRQMENLERGAMAKKSVTRDGFESSSGKRSVGGKTFERKQGVWYDSTYQGRPTINVSRGTAEFNRLDAGLRSIANSLGGTVVIVWGAKAYRIQ